MKKIFISWSVPLSKRIADHLYDWIEKIFQEKVTMFLSNKEIQTGSRWIIDIGNHLNDTAFGIFCITKENINSSWINFEAGAISKKLIDSKVCPVLNKLPRPLGRGIVQMILKMRRKRRGIRPAASQ
jgi:hypothetical protein